ncbi:MAG: Trm112 family protein [Candidatus Aenigmarchaeota archaeon]|nr:Trm112 family protein [Candidatus Aenigmarchaeota archaeon]
MALRKELLSILACPKCKGGIEEKSMFMACRACSLAFPVLGDVPDMLVEDAWPLEKAGKAKFRHSLKL